MEKRGRRVDDERASGMTRHVKMKCGVGVKEETRGEAVSRSESGRTRRREGSRRVVNEIWKVDIVIRIVERVSDLPVSRP
jgi:hypothetical protein